MLAPRDTYGQSVDAARVTVSGLDLGRYQVDWIDDTTGELIRRDAATADRSELELVLPTFRRHLAGKLSLVR